jgi:hypothetical protein
MDGRYDSSRRAVTSSTRSRPVPGRAERSSRAHGDVSPASSFANSSSSGGGQGPPRVPSSFTHRHRPSKVLLGIAHPRRWMMGTQAERLVTLTGRGATRGRAEPYCLLGRPAGRTEGQRTRPPFTRKAARTATARGDHGRSPSLRRLCGRADGGAFGPGARCPSPFHTGSQLLARRYCEEVRRELNGAKLHNEPSLVAPLSPALGGRLQRLRPFCLCDQALGRARRNLVGRRGL